MNRRAAMSLASLALALAGCSQPATRESDLDSPAAGMACTGQLRSPLEGVACTEELRAGLVVEVRDAVTGLPAASGATGVISDGHRTETLLLEGGATVPPEEALQLVGAWECPGLYEVDVTKPGYAPWSMHDVLVTGDECHVIQVRLQAALQPAP